MESSKRETRPLGKKELISPSNSVCHSVHSGVEQVSILEWVARKEGGNPFKGVCNFYIKNKLKSEIFSDKKSL